jgi:hypothetical protein
MFSLGIAGPALVGFWFGVREGWQLALSADAAPRGVMATGNLNALANGKADGLRTIFESDIDNGLLGSHALNISPLRELLSPVWGIEVYPYAQEYVVRLAAYRKANPSPFKADTFDIVPPGKEAARDFFHELAQSHRENVKVIDQMVERYASKP